MEFQPSRENLISLHFSEFHSYINVLKIMLHCRVCQMPHKTSCQVADNYFISSRNLFQSYCETSLYRGCVNQIGILKQSKDLLECLQSRSLFSSSSIKIFDFSILYTTVTHSKHKPKSKLWFTFV